jgi:hypothetical protein
MLDTRREFMNALAGAGAIVAMRLGSLTAQAKPARQPIQQPKETEGQNEDAARDKSQTKAFLDANEKDIKKAVEKLYELASDLKTEVEKTDSSRILSLALIKKAEEIEKLAKDIKARAKG